MKRLLTAFLVAGLATGVSAPVSGEEQDDGGWQPGQAGQNAGGNEGPREPVPAVDRGRITAGTEFNPAISVILDGVYRNDFSGEVEDPAGFGGGHDHGHGHGHDHGIDEGMQLREAEITLSGTVDRYLDAMTVLAVDEGGNVEIEEAFIQTRSLPAGLRLKAGRFLSDIGYINRQHIHDWDFVDRPLVSDALFGDEGLRETGVQATWLAPLPFYNQYGIEVLEGNNPGVAAFEGSGSHTITGYDTGEDPLDARQRSTVSYGLDDRSGPRLFTAFTKFGPDLGFDHAAQFGLSGGYASSWQDVETHGSGRVDVWEGDAWFAGVDAVYKYDAGRAYGHGNWTLQAEYFFREISVDYENREPTDWNNDEDEGWELNGAFSDTARQDGLYLQALYGFAPRWNVGLRAEAVGLKNDTLEPNDARTAFESEDITRRYSGQVRFMPTEFSIIRAQLNYLDVPGHGHHDDGAWTFMLQYNVSLGQHGAHEF